MNYKSPNGKNWKIKFVPLTNYNLIINEQQCRGATHFAKRKIYISQSLPKDDIRIVLIHELVHATLYDSQLDDKESYTEENVCDFMATYGDYIISKADKIIGKIKSK